MTSPSVKGPLLLLSLRLQDLITELVPLGNFFLQPPTQRRELSAIPAYHLDVAPAYLSVVRQLFRIVRSKNRRFRMPLILWIVLMAVSSCTPPLLRPYKSDWTVLRHAHQVDCKLWPIAHTDLATNEVRIIHGLENHGYYNKNTTRKDREAYYAAPFSDDYGLSPDMLSPMAVPSESSWLGGGNSMWATASTTLSKEGPGNGYTEILIHSLLSKKPPRLVRLRETPDRLWAGAAPGGLWLHSQTEGLYRLALIRVDPVSGKKPVISPIKAGFPDKPFLAGDPLTGNAWLVYARQSSPSDTGHVPVQSANPDQHQNSQPCQFLWQRFSTNGLIGKPVILALPGNDEPESWSILTEKGGFYLARITGNSLAGDARLILSAYSLEAGSPTPTWSLTKDLENIHLGKIFWTYNAGAPVLLVLQWMDGESTIAAYKLTAPGILTTTYLGVFPQGGSIADTFMDRKSGVTYSLIRLRGEYGWNYRLCELSKI